MLYKNKSVRFYEEGVGGEGAISFAKHGGMPSRIHIAWAWQYKLYTPKYLLPGTTLYLKKVPKSEISIFWDGIFEQNF